MKKILIILTLLTTTLAFAQNSTHKPENQKTIDEGGSGLFKAIALREKSLPQFVVYRPKDLYWASTREKKLPVLIWGNGGCMDTSVGYERMLIEIASQGYIVIAIGEMQMVYGDRKEVHTPSTMMADALNWLCKQVKDKNSDYYDCVDTTKMAAAGHSCGGAQVLFNSASPRLSTYLILNAGMGDMEMAGASKSSLGGLHGPILYLTGGEGDVAYKNAQLDYDRISKVPVAYGDMSKAGHGGTYKEKGGGDFGRMVLAWLDWQLKGKTQQKNVFLESDLRAFPGWTMTQKNFATDNTVREQWIDNGTRRIYGIISEPTSKENKGVAIISHGFNGTHHFGRDYFKTLNELGYLVYTFDYPSGSVNSRSDNNTINMSVIDQKEDLKAIVHYFQQQPNVDKTKIVLIGESQGGFISALAAADLKEQVSRLVLIYPALCIPDNWNQRYPNIKDIPDVTKLWNIPLGRRFFEQLRDIDVYKTITDYKGPVQIVHGSKDAVVPLSYSEKAMKLYKQAHLGVIPGAGHGFKPSERETSNLFVKEFLSNY
ncbi:MAG: hypothetical protein RIS29_2597 [Bacteroidota bacterium]|jgi:pimeloyl-ACP methyl ester carboxylesterase